MKTVGFIIRFLFIMIGLSITFCMATFFLSVFMLEEVQQAVEFFTNLLKIP